MQSSVDELQLRRCEAHLVFCLITMKRSVKKYLLLITLTVLTGLTVWAALHFSAPKLWRRYATSTAPTLANDADPDRWARAIDKVKEDRGQDANANVALDVPPELRHYEDRHWFLATQVAEVKKHNLRNCQDYLDVAAMISQGELVTVPVVTNDYVLFGVGAKADDEAFSRYEDDHSIALYDETQLRNAYQRLSDARGNTQSEITRLQKQLTSLSSRDRSKQRNLQEQISTQQQTLKSIDEEKTLLDESYGQTDKQQRLFSDYAALQTLAKNFRGRSYDLSNAADRQALKVAMLSSLRPPALKILEEIAAAYHGQFNRPLPVSSLVRPEEYQHTLRRFNRAAVLIDTPPHSTGLAFDIDYRYMSAAEQNFVMGQLANLKREGRIEVLRERGANFHVFAFIDGTRPSDDLIAASVEDASPSLKEANHASEKSPKAKPTATNKKAAKPARTKTKAGKRR